MTTVAGDGDFSIRSLGACGFESPVTAGATREAADRWILLDDEVDDPGGTVGRGVPRLEAAGPRPRLFFDPATVRMGVVTCGGLCPGINDVIRGLVMTAQHRYGVRTIYGFRYGFRGLNPDHGHEVVGLEHDNVNTIHEFGGSILASSRGPQDVDRLVNRLVELSVNVLFVVGGDGTLRGGLAIADEIERRGLAIAVVGVPKTIDNDIQYIDQSFGFETAYSLAAEAVDCAHTEALGTFNGIGLLKVMGRHSGFLACHAALAAGHVNFVLIPEAPFGDGGLEAFLAAVRERLARRRHAVILVAEGFGQELLERETGATDASGNARLGDIGALLAERIAADLATHGVESSLKYIDPSYILRSVPANPADSLYCWRLAENAVHAAMSGRTALLIARWHGRMVHVPIRQAVGSRKQVDLGGELWQSVLEATSQPARFGRVPAEPVGA